ncbi:MULTISPECIES: adenosine deaminase [unclassified Oceanispirochaeta]|uniref:adenosine deaminase n=1 Tax=unclassified Oceanispirochaeta TaxID=2635722 RepID=UPI000E09279E|nr:MULTISPECIES: adenosine deaminase [unclassified Oceanispirochaeta]MBF9015231.1 adenosine deaminase [Oceanispirochaeta sp. M2]NPD71689.1 adenosine deaminase [Oceanispirochaeta sp. M1]RDG32884.1 adenosine deaminase [Oceanispirochaeta sp. M1]
MSTSLQKEFSKSLLGKDLLYKFPKIELHRHLEGTFDLDTLYNLSVKNDLDTPRDRAKFKEYCQFPKDHDSDFLLFLGKFHNNWYKSLDDVSEVVFNSVKNIKKEGLHYIELRFSPEHYALVNDFDRIDITKLVVDSANSAARQTDLKIKYILTFNRGKQTADGMIALYKKMLDLNIDSIVGVDLAGDEKNYPPELFIRFFDFVKKVGVHKIDIHAGEVTDSSQIWTAIDKLHADRIGHGVSAIHDKKLQLELIERQIYLCQCVISNFQTAAWSDTPTHPLPRLFRNNVPVSISSDDPTIQNANLVDDYRTIIESFDFNFQDLVDINFNTIDASFLSKDQKSTMKEDYSQALDSFIIENS